MVSTAPRNHRMKATIVHSLTSHNKVTYYSLSDLKCYMLQPPSSAVQDGLANSCVFGPEPAEPAARGLGAWAQCWPHLGRMWCVTQISLLRPVICVVNTSSQIGTTSGISLWGRRESSVTTTLGITSTDRNLPALLYHPLLPPQTLQSAACCKHWHWFPPVDTSTSLSPRWADPEV